MVDESFFRAIARIRLRYAILVAVLLFVGLDIGIRRLEATPDLMLRNEGESHLALPYMFEQIEHTEDQPVVVALGASVTQGVGNTTSETTWPLVLQRLLREQGRPARVFNFAAIGNGVGDNLALASEAVRRGADVLVVSLHYKLYSHQGALAFASTYRDTVYYLRDRDDFAELRNKHFLLSARDFLGIYIDQTIKSRWAFYREVPLLTYLATGRTEPLPSQLRKLLLPATERRIATLLDQFGTPEKRNADDLWQLQPEHYHRENQAAYAKVDIREDDAHFKLLGLIAELAETYPVKIIFFVNPLNQAANERFHYWDPQQLARFAELTSRIVQAHGAQWLDLHNAVDSRYFTDGDHLTMKGHAELAAVLAGTVAAALQGVQP